MLLTISNGKHTFEQEYGSISMDDVKDLTKAFMQIHHLDNCTWSLCGESNMTVDNSESQGLGALFG